MGPQVSLSPNSWRQIRKDGEQRRPGNLPRRTAASAGPPPSETFRRSPLLTSPPRLPRSPEAPVRKGGAVQGDGICPGLARPAFPPRDFVACCSPGEPASLPPRDGEGALLGLPASLLGQLGGPAGRAPEMPDLPGGRVETPTAEAAAGSEVSGEEEVEEEGRKEAPKAGPAE